VLSVWFYHVIADGSGSARIQGVWSVAVRALSEEGKEALSVLTGPDVSRSTSGAHSDDDSRLVSSVIGDSAGHDPSAAQRQLATLAGLENGKRPREGLQAELSTAKPLRESDYLVVTKLFRFPCSTIKNLSAHLTDVTKSHYQSLHRSLRSPLVSHFARSPSAHGLHRTQQEYARSGRGSEEVPSGGVFR
jgi:hypothetical protein